MSKEPIRKYFDVGPTELATTAVYSGGATRWSAGLIDPGAYVSAAGDNLWVTGLSQSDDDQGRVGQSINIETLDIRVKISNDTGAAGNVTNTLRMIVFSDEECDGNPPSLAEILLFATIATGGVMSFLNPSYFGRFKIIEDKKWVWNNATSQPREGFFLHESHHDMRGHRVMWDTTNSSAIANARKGHIFTAWLFEANTVASGVTTIVTTNPPAIQFTSRIRYRDT